MLASVENGASVAHVQTDHFAGEIAARYDDTSAEMFSPDVLEPTVDVLAELADGGPALELAIGTGRVAVPLRARGVPVHGIELSPDMVAQLRAKHGADDIEVTIGDMTTTRVDGRFRVVYLVFNSIGNVTTQVGQVRCFETAAAHLVPGGHFVIEVGVPDLQRLPPGETVRPFEVTAGHLGFDEYDVVTQSLISHHYYPDRETRRQVSVPFRYVWPAELDLMARLARMSLVHRWADWTRAPFTAGSRSHVSVWRLDDDG